MVLKLLNNLLQTTLKIGNVIREEIRKELQRKVLAKQKQVEKLRSYKVRLVEEQLFTDLRIKNLEEEARALKEVIKGV